MLLLRHKAPRRHWIRTEEGLWVSHPWTIEARQEAAKAGIWFGSSAEHDFA